MQAGVWLHVGAGSWCTPLLVYKSRHVDLGACIMYEDCVLGLLHRLCAPHMYGYFFGFIGHVVTALRHMPACAARGGPCCQSVWVRVEVFGPFSLATVCEAWLCCACTAICVGLSVAVHVASQVAQESVGVWRPCPHPARAVAVCLYGGIAMVPCGCGEAVGSSAVVFAGMGNFRTT
jgi:hypothetical protein